MVTFQALVDNIVWAAELDQAGQFVQWWMFGGTENSPIYSSEKLENFKRDLQAVYDLREELIAEGMVNFFNEIFSGLYSDAQGQININIENLNLSSYKAVVDNILYGEKEYYWGLYTYPGAEEFVDILQRLKNFLDTARSGYGLIADFEQVYEMLIPMYNNFTSDLLEGTDLTLLEFLFGFVGDKEFNADDFFRNLPYVAGLTQAIRTRPEFVEALNYFYEFDNLLPAASLHPKYFALYGQDYSNLSEFLFNIATLTGEDASTKAYPDIDTYVELAVKVYDNKEEIKDGLEKLGNYRFNLDPNGLGFGYMIRGGIVTLFIYDNISLELGLKQISLATYAVTLVPENTTLGEARFNWSQDSQLIKQAEIIVNLAAQAGVRHSLTNPDAYINANIVGFLNILEAARKFKVKHLLYASSSSVYGLNKNMPFTVHKNVNHPVSL